MTWQIIIAIIIPSVVVFLSVYFTFRQYHQQQLRLQLLENKKVKDRITLPMKLQAYERLILLCERIDFPDLLLRLKTPDTSARELEAALLVAVQHEYEHNLTQQLYISPELWDVLLAVKSKTMDLITLAREGMSDHGSSEEFGKRLFELISKETSLPSQIGRKAIKTEASLWL
ncbi:MAG TPA: hypothetical protein VMZ69_11245 [Saprospiraceae bacterium]|nr:hypothetical protein [Saprospiraceae bacterium]